jgi:holo-[acyl-carrier protein] synthase
MIGIDIVSIDRIDKMIKKFNIKAIERFLSKKEIKLANNKIETIAGFWAAKEAASKAIGTGIGKKCTFADIRISKRKNGQPILSYKKNIKKRFKISSSSLSITHDKGIAIAVVVNYKIRG